MTHPSKNHHNLNPFTGLPSTPRQRRVRTRHHPERESGCAAIRELLYRINDIGFTLEDQAARLEELAGEEWADHLQRQVLGIRRIVEALDVTFPRTDGNLAMQPEGGAS